MDFFKEKYLPLTEENFEENLKLLKGDGLNGHDGLDKYKIITDMGSRLKLVQGTNVLETLGDDDMPDSTIINKLNSLKPQTGGKKTRRRRKYRKSKSIKKGRKSYRRRY
jgi:hypothetical protein